MRPIFYLMLSVLASPLPIRAEAQAQPQPATAFHSVFYLEVMPSARAAALSALRDYREASRKDEGHVRVEAFEQIGRPGHFVMIETWGTEKAFEAHRMAAHSVRLLSQLQPLRLSDYDQRPYKTLHVGSAPPAPNTRMVYVITHVDIGGPAGDVPALLGRIADASRNEKGNQRFDVLQHTMRANHFTVI